MAAAAIFFLAGIGFYQSDGMSEFREYSNHNPHYVFAYVEECESGLREQPQVNHWQAPIARTLVQLGLGVFPKWIVVRRAKSPWTSSGPS